VFQNTFFIIQSRCEHISWHSESQTDYCSSSYGEGMLD
jgi:hypothetical protein